MGVPVYHLYSMRDTPENAPMMCQSYDYICANNMSVHESIYELVYDQGLLTDGMTITEVQAKLEAKPPEFMNGHSLSTSDVIVLKRDESISCFFCDLCGMVQIQGFFEQTLPLERQPLTPFTTDYQIEGADGLWNVTDTITDGDNVFFVLENGLPESVTFKYILAQDGTVVTNCGRNEAVAIDQIHAFMEKRNEEAKPAEEKPNEEVIHSDETQQEAHHEKLNSHSRDFRIKDRPGKWSTIETMEVEGELFYLMENQKFKDRLEWMILSSEEEIVVEKCIFGFNELTLMKIHEHIKKKKEKADAKETGKRISLRQRLKEKKELVNKKRKGLI